MFQYCSCFLFWVFGNEACGILACWPGIKPTPSALEGEILATGPPGKSPLASFKMYLVSIYTCLWGFPGGSEVKASTSDAGDLGLIPGSGRFPWRRKWQPTPVFLPGESHGRRSLVGYSPWGCKELDTTERLHFTSCFLYLFQLVLTLVCHTQSYVRVVICVCRNKTSPPLQILFLVASSKS